MTIDEMQYRVRIAPSAVDRMEEHFEFLAQVSSSAADKLRLELKKDIQSLQVMPYRNPSYRKCYLQPEKYRYLISQKRYRIIYQIVENTVFVDDIQDCRQNDDKDLI